MGDADGLAGVGIDDTPHILIADDVAAEVTRLKALGAVVVEELEDFDDTWVVMQDLESNEFCVGRLPT